MDDINEEILLNDQSDLINVKDLFKVMNEACLGSITEIVAVTKDGLGI